MIKLVVDENFDRRIIQGVIRFAVGLDAPTVQQLGLSGLDDPGVLEWAHRNGRVALTHDINTLVGHAYDRVRRGLPMAGVIVVPNDAPLGRVIHDLRIMLECSFDDEWLGQVRYIPYPAAPA